jgi:hypothetical protein
VADVSEGTVTDQGFEDQSYRGVHLSVSGSSCRIVPDMQIVERLGAGGKAKQGKARRGKIGARSSGPRWRNASSGEMQTQIM